MLELIDETIKDLHEFIQEKIKFQNINCGELTELVKALVALMIIRTDWAMRFRREDLGKTRRNDK